MSFVWQPAIPLLGRRLKPPREHLPQVPRLELTRIVSLGIVPDRVPSPLSCCTARWSIRLALRSPVQRLIPQGRAQSIHSVLTKDVDFGLLDPDVEPDNSQWTPVTRRTARSHRERSSSPSHSNYVSSNSRMNESPSTVSHATREMSEEQLLAVAHRYKSLAWDAYAAAR
jgi:hypothetical protein